MDDVIRTVKKPLIIFLIYLFSAFIYTFPLVLALNDILIGKGGLDGFQYIWNFYSFWHQIGNFQSPFFNQLIFYPVGANLLFSDYSAFTSLIGFPLLHYPVLFMNLIIILGLTFSSFFGYLLIYKLTKHRIASILGGFIYGFSPTMGGFIESQHNYYLFSSAFLPLLLLLLINFIETPNRFLKRFILVSWMLFFTGYYFFILHGIISLVFLGSLLILNKKVRKNIFDKSNIVYYLKSSIFLLISILLVGGLILYHAGDLSSWSSSSSSYAASCNANLAGLITPSQQSFLLSDLSRSMYDYFNFSENGDTPFYYLGIVFILVTFVGVILYRKEKYIVSLCITLLVVLFFSLGLVVRFGAIPLLEDSDTPFFYLAKLPLLGMIDCPIRFIGGVHLLIAILFSIFLTKILERKKVFGVVIIIFGFISLVTDYTVSNFSFVSVYTPKVYSEIAKINDQKTILELPSGLAESKGAFGYDWPSEGLHTRQLYWQTQYEKPRVGGYISRIPPTTYEYFKTTPVISDLFTMTSLNGEWTGKTFTVEEKQQFIKEFNLGYIIIEPEERQKEFQQVVEELLIDIPHQKSEIDNYLLYRIMQR